MQPRERTARLRQEVERRFGSGPAPLLVRAPGRVNLIGEHTDYNDGFVLPIAIERDVRFAVRPRADRRVRLHSLDYDEETAFDLEAVRRDEEQPWGNYVRGVAVELAEEGLPLCGMEGVVQGDVPIGAGLSSSAAMEVAAGLALCAAAGLTPAPERLALAAQRAENRYVGVRCGIMDQFASCLCRAEHALFLDCRSLACEWIPLRLAGWRVVIANSGEGRELAGSAYNERRAQCEAAVAVLAEADPAVTALRDASSGALERARGRMDAVAYRRARHVVSENERVLAAVEALRAGDLGAFGALMSASHDSLRDDYEVSSPALDGLVEAAREVEGCAGSRLTGAGFGGCTVSLVRAERVEAFREQVAGRYRAAFGRPPRFYTTRAAPGAGIIPADEG